MTKSGAIFPVGPRWSPLNLSSGFSSGLGSSPTPRAAVEEAAGIRLPDDYRIHVHEESATDAHVVLPPNPKLSREQLDHIAGGLKKPPKWP